jgi:hypothetical protein
MTDISEAERLAFITREQVALVLEEAESAELEARAFSQDRARQRLPYGLHRLLRHSLSEEVGRGH